MFWGVFLELAFGLIVDVRVLLFCRGENFIIFSRGCFIVSFRCFFRGGGEGIFRFGFKEIRYEGLFFYGLGYKEKVSV